MLRIGLKRVRAGGAKYKKYPGAESAVQGAQEITGRGVHQEGHLEQNQECRGDRCGAAASGPTTVDEQTTEAVYGTTPTPATRLQFYERLAAELLTKCGGRAGDMVKARRWVEFAGGNFPGAEHGDGRQRAD